MEFVYIVIAMAIISFSFIRIIGGLPGKHRLSRVSNLLDAANTKVAPAHPRGVTLTKGIETLWFDVYCAEWDIDCAGRHKIDNIPGILIIHKKIPRYSTAKYAATFLIY